ncbi:MAG: LUD domain-containing protein [Bryobacterales bacterium]|nr:LUD domain-containing protein [Bryobacterales bacterium]
MSKEAILGSIRAALGRAADAPVPVPPPARIVVPEVSQEARTTQFLEALDGLNANTFHASTPEEAISHVAGLLAGRAAIASNSPLLAELGIVSMPGVLSGVMDLETLREEAEARPIGITSADYALADTGTLVMLASVAEARLVSLLPPIHIALVPREKLLSGLDELLERVPKPAAVSSSMVLITGPSRTADIEQILVRGVHGPGELHVVLL